MNNIIFLDIDGVLNSQKFLIEQNNKNVLDLVERQISDIDPKNLEILKEIIFLTNSKVVITSSWRKLNIYPLVKEKLIDIGIPIIGETPIIESKRGEEIRKYIKENNVENYIIIDDDIFEDFYELKNYLVKTSFYENGLEEFHKDIAFKLLK